MLHILLLLLALSSSSFGENIITLSNVDDFTNFAKSVNSKNDYLGSTVFLGSDVTLFESIDPIGIDYTCQFRGVFDGQGHIISNLQINSSLENTGLFGFSEGLTIKNVVLDDSCTISSYSELETYVGGIIGWFWADDGECNIENNVNMADVTFNGSIKTKLLMGGIVGSLYYDYEYNVYVKNCVNYGSVTASGVVGHWAYLGGVAGSSNCGSLKPACNYIQNCLNYGTITHNGTSANLYIGGVVGDSISCTYIENCVSAGKVATLTTASSKNCIGGIVGNAYLNTYINYCYYTSDVNASSINGTGTPESIIGTPITPTSVDLDLVSQLNSNATSCNWDKWFMLHLNGGNINNLTQDPLIEIQGHIPNPVKEGNSFLYWCKDAECTEEFDSKSVSGITALYAAWVNNAVTFDFGNGTIVNETFSYNTEIAYPDIKKEGYTLSWSNYHELMPAKDITVTAQWTPNDYTVTFDANGGSVSETSIIVAFDEEYEDLPEPERTGYMFLGWFTEKINGTEVTNETIVTTPYNHTLYAHWEEVTNQVEIVFITKDLTQEEVKKLVEQYTGAGYEIISFEIESGEIRVIVGFTNKEDAEDFVRKIKESDRATNFVKKINFVSGDADSFSTTAYPPPFFSFL